MYSIKFWRSNGTGLSVAEIRELYQAGAADGTLNLVAYDCPELSGDLFETFVRRLDRIGFFAGVYDACARPLGFFFLSCFEGETARVHFCVFSRAAGERHELGGFVLKNIFRLFKLKSLIGVVPVINPGAARYCAEMGGARRGLIPGACWIARLRRAVGGIQFLFLPEKQEVYEWADSIS